MRRTAVLLTTGIVLLLATACGSSGDSPTADSSKGAAESKPGVTVDMPLLSFKPMSATVKTGETVTWVNGNDIGHVLVQGAYEVGGDNLRTSETDDKTFNLVVSKKGDKVEHSYDKAGTFPYYCTIHKGMNGTVTVQ